jgi:hypothetical protein
MESLQWKLPRAARERSSASVRNSSESVVYFEQPGFQRLKARSLREQNAL